MKWINKSHLNWLLRIFFCSIKRWNLSRCLYQRYTYIYIQTQTVISTDLLNRHLIHFDQSDKLFAIQHSENIYVYVWNISIYLGNERKRTGAHAHFVIVGRQWIAVQMKSILTKRKYYTLIALNSVCFIYISIREFQMLALNSWSIQSTNLSPVLCVFCCCCLFRLVVDLECVPVPFGYNCNITKWEWGIKGHGGTWGCMFIIPCIFFHSS